MLPLVVSVPSSISRCSNSPLGQHLGCKSFRLSETFKKKIPMRNMSVLDKKEESTNPGALFIFCFNSLFSNCVRTLLLPSMKMHSSAVLSLLVFLFVKSQLELVRASVERYRVGTGTDGTPAGGGRLRLNVCCFSLENRQQKARASRSRASLLNTVPVLRDRVVCQYNSGMIARREQNAPPPLPPSIGCGLPGPYGGSAYGKARLPVSVYIVSPLASKKSPRLTAPVPSDDGSRKPARPYVWKDTLILRSMLSQRHVESRRWRISRYSLQEIILSRCLLSEIGETKYTTVTKRSTDG